MDARNWPPLVQALPLPEVAELLEIPHRHLLELIAQGLIAVCTRKPMAVGGWEVNRLGFWTPVVDVSERQPFDGRRLARLCRREASRCVASGQVLVHAVHEEPLNHEVYVDRKREQWSGPCLGTVVATDDLLISRVEFEHFIHYFGFNYPRQPEQWRPTSEVAEQPPPSQPRDKLIRQEQAVLDTLRRLGYAPEALPPRQLGRKWVKAEVRSALAGSDLFEGEMVLDKAWERLRAADQIAEQS